MITEDEINTVYAALQLANRDYYKAQEEYLKEKYNLEKNINRAYADCLITGKNEIERNGNIAQTFGNQLDHVQDLKVKAEDAKYNREWYQIEIDRIQAVIRLMEVLEEK